MSSKVDRSEWVWMPHPAHYILSAYCQFRLATWVPGDTPNAPGWIVSTVGEMLPRDFPHRENPGITKIGEYLYETMVFTAASRTPHNCCLYVPENYIDIDFAGANTPAEAYSNHIKLCEEYHGKSPDFRRRNEE